MADILAQTSGYVKSSAAPGGTGVFSHINADWEVNPAVFFIK
jgi:hypothetical protein